MREGEARYLPDVMPAAEVDLDVLAVVLTGHDKPRRDDLQHELDGEGQRR